MGLLYSVSMMFEYDPVATQVDSGAGLFVGFGSTSTWVAQFSNSGVGTDNQFMVGLTGITGGDRRLVNYYVADGIRTQDSGASATLTAGNWYELRLDVVNNFDNTYDILSTLNNVDGATGVVGSQIISNDFASFTNTDFAGGADMYAFFGGQGQSDNRVGVNYDNFSAVPEPSTYALIGLVLASLVLMRRNRLV